MHKRLPPAAPLELLDMVAWAQQLSLLAVFYQGEQQIQEDKDYNFIFKDWANQQTSEIPQKIIEQVQEENRKPEGLEKLRLEISSGKYNNIIMIALGILALIISIFYIRYKRKKDKNTLFKK